MTRSYLTELPITSDPVELIAQTYEKLRHAGSRTWSASQLCALINALQTALDKIKELEARAQ